ncbi:MAG TPA: hypothetical protein VGR73_23395 [Bryobacteraceae bacterium]|nr:hypothetical protein [Bryobacteraceae bacterium]
MSWSDDTRCLYCDGKLPLYRKITSGQFCSAAHRRAYWQEQERLAVERLSQTHDSLRAYRPPGAEAILGAAPALNPFYLDKKKPVEDAVLAFAREASNRDRVTLAEFFESSRPAASPWRSAAPAAPAPLNFPTAAPALPPASGADPVWLFEVPVAATMDLASTTAPAVMERNRADVQPLSPEPAQPSRTVELTIAPEKPSVLMFRVEAAPVEIAPAAIAPAVTAPVTSELIAIAPVAIAPLSIAPVEIAPVEIASVEIAPAIGMEPAAVEFVAVEPAKEEDAAPPMAAAVASANIAAGKFEFSPAPIEISPVENKLAAPVLLALEKPGVACAPAAGKMLALLAPRTSASSAAPIRSAVDALDVPVPQLAPENVQRAGLATPSAEMQLPMAPAARFPLRGSCAVPPRTTVEPAEIAPRQAAIPALGLDPRSPISDPASGWLVELPVQPGTPAVPVAAHAAGMLLAIYPPGFDPCLPGYNFEPADGSEVPPPPHSFLDLANWTAGDPSRANAWGHVADFWKHAPRDLKLLLFAIPVLLTLALHPRLPKVHVTAPAASAGIQQAFANQFKTVQQNVASRAGVALAEDFRSGLDEWQTRGDLSAAWSFDTAGFVRPGSLALYRPSMRLSDYELQFLGLIDKKALSFVVRAQDYENYYVIKLVVLKPGPLPTIGVTRYAVIQGKPQNRVDSLAPITALPDMLYRVSLDVHDDTYLLSLQGKVMDSWSEPRLRRGGVGFFAPRGEESRLRWVQVTHQYDMLGRLCAYLAPYNIPTTNGSW